MKRKEISKTLWMYFILQVETDWLDGHLVIMQFFIFHVGIGQFVREIKHLEWKAECPENTLSLLNKYYRWFCRKRISVKAG